ncbi:MAG: family 78 glycoside hydrolase catalytic domain [Clostridia bacterium]|nr:family 78 glycoside hydrolase catalytic domain [Clostridia bacterium]MBR2447053.1 family 78 glycoside hydrolase catalytic domain [Clostridia bacterium]
MQPLFICHPDFAAVVPQNPFHKQFGEHAPMVQAPALQNRHILYRRKAVLPAFEKAVLRVSADDYYKLYIGGRFVTMGPAPSYPQNYFYNEIDVTEYLGEGENTFALHTLYQGLVNRVWVSGEGRHMMYFDLYLDGKQVLVSDTDWLCADHTAYTATGKVGYDTAFLERYDSRAPEVGFAQPDFDDSAWQHAAIFASADYVMHRQPTAQLDVYRTQPARVSPVEGGVLLDFGREAVGYLALSVKGLAGDVVRVRCAEELDGQGRARYAMRCNCTYEEQWVLSGGRDTLDQFDYKAFRYAEVLLPEGAKLIDAAMIVRHYPCVERAEYPTENAALTRVLRLCADTVKYGVQEVFPDCPTREKGQYLGDVAISARAQATLTGDTAMIKKAIRDFCATSCICPGLMAVSTSSYMQEIADYSLQFPALVCWVYAMDGDVAFVREVEPYATGLYQYFLRYANADGLLDGVSDKWNLVDWPANLRDGYDFELPSDGVPSGVHNVINAFWCGCLGAMDELYAILGKPATGMTERVKDAFVKTFYSPELGLYVDAPGSSHVSVHSNLLPLLFDIGTRDKDLCTRLGDFIVQKGLSAMGVYMAYFALAALVGHDRYEDAVRLATDPACWLLMLDEGATTTFEAWGKEQKWNTSLFHPWASAPLIVFAENIRVY